MSEEFYARFWKLVAAVLVVFILCASGCNVNKQYVMRDMVADGADPMVAACAVYIGETDQVNCVAHYLSQK